MFSATFTYVAGEFDEEFHQLDARIAAAARAIPGYLGEETWENRESGKISNIYYWDSLEALQALIDNPDHRHAKQQAGRWLERYHVSIAQVLRSYGNGGPGFAVGGEDGGA